MSSHTKSKPKMQFYNKNHNKGTSKKNFRNSQENPDFTLSKKNKFYREYLSEKKKREVELNKNELQAVEGNYDPYAKYNCDREVFEALPGKKPRQFKFKRATKDFQEVLETKQRLKAERLKEKEEIEERKKKYKQERVHRQRIMRQKTKRGQPVMKGRMELLLKQVEKLVGNND